MLGKEISCDKCCDALSYPYKFTKKDIIMAARSEKWEVGSDGRALCPSCAGEPGRIIDPRVFQDQC